MNPVHQCICSSEVFKFTKLKMTDHPFWNSQLCCLLRKLTSGPRHFHTSGSIGLRKGRHVRECDIQSDIYLQNQWGYDFHLIVLILSQILGESDQLYGILLAQISNIVKHVLACIFDEWELILQLTVNTWLFKNEIQNYIHMENNPHFDFFPIIMEVKRVWDKGVEFPMKSKLLK